MKANKFVNRTLLIRDDEWVLVRRLFSFEFFQGIAIAIFFYCSITIFLKHLPTENLAYAFILTAFLLWLAGAVYSKLEHHLETKNLILFVVVINAILILLFRFGLMFHQPVWFYYLMLGGFNVAYLLNNLEFWGSAALLFDVRQSKRLFSIISAGDIPAKLVGFLASAFLGNYLGQENLLWIAFGSLVISLYFFRLLVESKALETDHHHHKKGSDLHMNPTAENAVKIIKTNPLIRQAALISFFSYSAFILLNFLFFGYIKEASHTHDETLAIYIGVFLAASRAITLIVKLTVTNRLADNLGIKNALLITPIILFLLSLIVLPAAMRNSITTVFYAFATITIITDVLRSAIQSPVLLAAMQPLPVHERLSGHTIIKGITDPFAFFSIGAILSIAFWVRADVDYSFMSIVLFILVLGWILTVMRFGKIYNAALQKAIRNRSIQEREISITDRGSQQILLNKVLSGEPGEAILALKLVKDQSPEIQYLFLRNALRHPSPYVQREAIMLCEHWRVTAIIPDLKELVSTAGDHKVVGAAIGTLASMDKNFDYSKFLDHPNPDVVMGTIADSLKRSDLLSGKAKSILESWCRSNDKSHRLRASIVLGEIHNEELHRLLIALMKDPDKEVSTTAISSAGHLANRLLATEILSLAADIAKQPIVLQALQNSGAAAVPSITHYIVSTTNEALQKKMISLLGRIGNSDATLALDHLTDELPLLKEDLFRAMHHCGFKADQNNHHKYQKFIRDYLNSASHLTYVIRFLQQNYSAETLTRAFETELLALREKLLQLFSFLYSKESMRKVTAGFDLGTRESISNGLEIVAVSAAREFAKEFICIYEPTSYDQKCVLLGATYPEPHLTKSLICDEVLRDQRHQYHAWTKACVMYFMKNDLRQSEKKSADVFRFSANPLLKETAEWLLKTTGLATD